MLINKVCLGLPEADFFHWSGYFVLTLREYKRNKLAIFIRLICNLNKCSRFDILYNPIICIKIGFCVQL